MLTGIQHLHGTLRWVVLGLMIFAILKAFTGMSSGKTFGDADRKRGLFTMIALHMQLLLGFVLYFGKDWHTQFGIMDDARVRFFSLEHAFMMTLAIIMGTLGYSLSKRATNDGSRFRRQAIWFSLALLVILAAIPWPFREALGDHGWFI